MSYFDREPASVRELSFLSGMEGEVGELFPRTPERTVTVRGHEARVVSVRRRHLAVWQEAPEGEACGQHAVIAAGLDRAEWRKVLDELG